MNSIEQKLSEAIKQHLPEQVAGEMKAFIAGAEANKVSLDLANATIKTKDQNIEKLNAKIADLEAKVKRDYAAEVKDKELATKQLELEKRERDLDITILKNDKAMLERQAAEFNNLMQTVFRNPTTTTNQNVGYYRTSEFNNNTGRNEMVTTGENITTTSQVTK